VQCSGDQFISPELPKFKQFVWDSAQTLLH
jgi:hypothetical protein